MSNEYIVDIIALAEELEYHSAGRFVCPLCGGGSGKERSLLITREILRCTARCWRATCSLGAKVIVLGGSGGRVLPTSRPSSKRKSPTSYEGEIALLTPPEEAQLILEWDCEEFVRTLRTTPEGDIVIPIWDSSGTRRGDVVRQRKPYDTSRVKSLSLYEGDYSGLAWFTPDGSQGSDVLCVVEDPISAMRLAQHGVTGVSLLGVSLNPRRVRELIPCGGSTGINLALDADAHGTSVRYMKMFGNRIDLRVHRLFNDVKDMDSEELLNFLRVIGV